MPAKRCVVIGPNSGVTLAGTERNLLLIADGPVVYLQVDFDTRVVVLGDGAGPYVVADFKGHPGPVLWARGIETTPYETAVKAFEDFAQVFRESYESDPEGGLAVKKIEERTQELTKAQTFDELISQFKVEGEDEEKS
jgi:hypothetical protein